MDNEEIDDHPHRVEALADNLAELRSQFCDFGRDQAKQTRSLDLLSGKFNSLERSMSDRDLAKLADDVKVIKADVAGVKADMTELRDNVTVLEVKVDKLEGKVDELQADVRELKADVTEVKGSLREILDRLPAEAA